MLDFDEILANLPGGEAWSTDGYGLDSLLIHDACGTLIEQDCRACPECGTLNPVAGLL